MVYEVVTPLTPDEVFDRAENFFAERVPTQAVFPEHRGAAHLVLRGQGGEEVVVAAWREEDRTAVRASTLMFDQLVGRFLTTLPVVELPA